MQALVAEDPDELSGVAGWAVDVMERLGGFGAGLLIALENLFPPLPSEIVLPLAGFAASRGSFSLTSALLWTTAGSLAGALVLYFLGERLGRDRVFALWCRLPLIEERDFLRTEAWFARHGRKAVFFGRMLPLFRSLISVPAGVDRMPVWEFALLTTAGSAVWNTAFVLAGYLLGEEWHLVEPVIGWLQWVVLAVVVLLTLRWLVPRVRHQRQRRRGER
ncbi:DedA family protein [Nocardioides ferulae]|uniref:DedA family protein n=1 Tax=Nocardioides ferulae TaxID=2340821 RepID=UPI001F0CA8D0|nr:DedA family protein [Nocardioides ferulae]